MVTVAAFTGGTNVPSARYRVRQYRRVLRDQGIFLTEYVARWNCYPPRGRWLRYLWAPGTVLSRLPSIAGSYRHDVTLLQREMLSTFRTLEHWTKAPRVFDVDDAIWLRRGGRFAAEIARRCDRIICGNSFLAERFRSWNRNVHVLPTAVDTMVYKPAWGSGECSMPQFIGWCGTSSGLKYLRSIEGALLEVLRARPNAELMVICDRPPAFERVPADRVLHVPWTPSTEVPAIQRMAAGIMPLDDSLTARGKCSYKMLTYMACGVPTVVSPIGMNTEVLAFGRTGFGATNAAEWSAMLIWLLDHPEEARRMGDLGRQVVEANYSLEHLAPILANILKSVVGDKVK